RCGAGPTFLVERVRLICTGSPAVASISEGGGAQSGGSASSRGAGQPKFLDSCAWARSARTPRRTSGTNLPKRRRFIGQLRRVFKDEGGGRENEGPTSGFQAPSMPRRAVLADAILWPQGCAGSSARIGSSVSLKRSASDSAKMSGGRSLMTL